MMAERSGGQGWRIAGWSLAGALLLMPALAMRFTDEVRWTGGDFAFAAVLIGAVGVALELAGWRSRDWSYRLGAAAALLAAFGLVWVNAAVGIIGDEDHPANLLFGGLLLAILIGGAAVRFRARGLVRVMRAAAALQVVIAATAALAGWGSDGPIWPWDVVGASGLFAGLWLLAAALFGRAAIKSAA